MIALSARTAVTTSVLLMTLMTGCSGSVSSTSSGSVSGAPSGGPSGGGGPGGSSCSALGASPTAATSGAVPDASDEQAVSAAVAAATAFYDTLDTTQQETVLESYADLDAKRCSWSNFPDGLFSGRLGMKLGDMSDAQRSAALAAVKSVLSAAGVTYLEQMMAGDDYLLEQSGDTNYGSDNYHIVFYGTPSTDQPWTLQFGGHHLALHVSVGGGTLSFSPFFKGNQPVSFEADGTTIEAMGSVRDSMFGLFESLDETQLASAKLSGTFSDLVMGPGTDTGYPDSEGLAYTALTDAQKKLVQSTIAGYVGDATDALAEPLLALYTSTLDEVKVSWSTAITRDSQSYMRIDGPRLWIEWVNTGNPGESGIHYHTVYRDKQLDYGTGTGG